MPTIKVPFPKYEGMEVKKVTADIEKGYSVVEYGEKEPIQKDILVPDSIGIYKTATSGFGDRLLIGFNNNKQLLGYNSQTNQWMVFTYVDCQKKIPCKLTPCKREELREGDTAFWTYESQIKLEELIDITSYCKIIDNKDAIYIEHNLTCVCIDDDEIFWYKVEPIQ